MPEAVKNAKQEPRRYFGLHMEEGVAEYTVKGTDGKPSRQRLFVTQDVLKQMNASAEGVPVPVLHTDDVDPKDFEKVAVGIVVKSFFNPTDGKHWCEFMVWGDEGHESIRKGWKLSNQYDIVQRAGAGTWHDVQYAVEVKEGRYTAICLVPDPRYESSIILTPDEFRAYNLAKEQELTSIANSKGTDAPKGQKQMGFLDRLRKPAQKQDAAPLTKLEDLDENTILTAKNGKEFTLGQVMNMVEGLPAEAHQEPHKFSMANSEHYVKIGNDNVKVAELEHKFNSMKNALDAAEKKAKDLEDAKNAKDTEEEKEKEKAKNSRSSESEVIEADASGNVTEDHFAKIKNASDKAMREASAPTIDLSMDQLARGRSRYGSGS
jgi:hypothetical protein